MAPRTRSSRAAKLEKDKVLARAGVLNREGFLALPDEIHLEIVSHFPVMPVPTYKLEEEDPDGLNSRHITLLALSQTCRALRRIFLGQLWQRIEVFDGMRTPKGSLPKTSVRATTGPASMRLKLYAEELLRQLETVTIREPGLAQYVKVVNVVISHYSVKSVLDEVAKAFAVLPKLHTVQLALDALPLKRTYAFRNQEYPQIRSLSLSRSAFSLADSCPGARLIVPYVGRCFSDLPRNCPNLEVLGTTCLSRKHDVCHLNNLQDISLMCDTTHSTLSELFEPLCSLPRLHTIRLRMDIEESCWAYYSFRNDVDTRIEYARMVLAGKAGNKSSKKIIVTHKDGRVETLGV